MKTVYILFGPPLSGKSYFTRLVTKNDTNCKVVSRDMIRDMLNDHSQNMETEKLVTKIYNNSLMAIIDNSEYDLILDNTHYRLQYVREALTLLDKCKNNFEVKLIDFTDINLELLIKRNEVRDRKVSVDVIKKIYQTCKMNLKEVKSVVNSFVKQKHIIMKTSDIRRDLPRAVIVDIDGTLAHKNDRNAYDYKNADKDECDEVISELTNQLYRLNYRVIILSGREDSCCDLTIEWLNKHMISYHDLHMRKSKDMRKDAVVKKEIYNQQIKDNYSVLCVFDDRNQVVEMWREIGLKCLQVQEGDF